MRTSTRVTGAAVALAAALFASGCGSDSDDEKGNDSPSQEETTGSDDGSGSADNADLDGGWIDKGGKPKLVLGVENGKVSMVAVGASSAEASVRCDGSVEGEKIDLTCEKGDYSEGTIQESSEKSMTVKWNTGDSTDFVKSPEGDVPTDAPTEMPTDVPTDVPTDPNDL